MKVYALYNGWVQGEIDGIQINGKNYSAEDILATAKALADAERALSSANHIADAGKVEGEGWLPMTHPDLPLNGASVVMFDSFAPGKDGFGQVIARFDKKHSWHVSASVVGGIYIKLTNPIKWRPLFSAPASEGAE